MKSVKSNVTSHKSKATASMAFLTVQELSQMYIDILCMGVGK